MQFPAIDPVAFSIGSLQLRWYGLMYLLAFFVGWGLARWRASRPGSGWKTVDVDDLLTFVMLGVILGARLGYVLFYDLPAYIDDPGEILRIWNGGMSFHGGLLGVLCAFCRGVVGFLHAIPLVWRTVVGCFIVGVMICLMADQFYYRGGQLIAFLFILSIAVCLFSIQLRKLQKEGEALAAGNLDAQVDTKWM